VPIILFNYAHCVYTSRLAQEMGAGGRSRGRGSLRTFRLVGVCRERLVQNDVESCAWDEVELSERRFRRPDLSARNLIHLESKVCLPDPE
jgi:hypothetical protein